MSNDTANLALRLTGNDSSKLALGIYFLFGMAHRLFVQLFGPVISYVCNDDTAPAFFSVNISQVFPRELKRFARFAFRIEVHSKGIIHCAMLIELIYPRIRRRRSMYYSLFGESPVDVVALSP